MSSQSVITTAGKFLGETEEEREERWAVLAKLGFERRLRFHSEELYGDGTPEEFEVLCEALEVQFIRNRKYLLWCRCSYFFVIYYFSSFLNPAAMVTPGEVLWEAFL